MSGAAAGGDDLPLPSEQGAAAPPWTTHADELKKDAPSMVPGSAVGG